MANMNQDDKNTRLDHFCIDLLVQVSFCVEVNTDSVVLQFVRIAFTEIISKCNLYNGYYAAAANSVHNTDAHTTFCSFVFDFNPSNTLIMYMGHLDCKLIIQG